MAIKEEQSRRVRAWILVQADRPLEAAQSLYDWQKDEGGDSYVVVRADVVRIEGHDYNIVIPVDAESDDHLGEAVGKIRDHTGVEDSQIAILRVLDHIPIVPHLAQGYITLEEYEADEYADEEGIQPGRQMRNSPGENAWG